MEKDFHYHLIYSIAKMTEFKNADIIGYASQFVDDNNEGQFSIDGEEAMFPQQIEINGGNYYPIMTQSLSTKSLDLYVQKYVYVPFHFLLGIFTDFAISEKLFDFFIDYLKGKRLVECSLIFFRGLRFLCICLGFW